MHGIDFIKDLAVVMLVAGFVGWACHRAGLSVVVGYLVAGMVVGPYTPPFSLVSDVTRIETLAQIGLVFLMFSIGMGLSLRKLRRLGLSLLVATFTGAIIMYNLTRAVGGGAGLDQRSNCIPGGDAHGFQLGDHQQDVERNRGRRTKNRDNSRWACRCWRTWSRSSCSRC